VDGASPREAPRVAYGGTVGPGRNKKPFTLLGKAGSDVVESAAILMEFVATPHERGAAVAEHSLVPHGAR
jgi:hypothetical protein